MEGQSIEGYDMPLPAVKNIFLLDETFCDAEIAAISISLKILFHSG